MKRVPHFAPHCGKFPWSLFRFHTLQYVFHRRTPTEKRANFQLKYSSLFDDQPVVFFDNQIRPTVACLLLLQALVISTPKSLSVGGHKAIYPDLEKEDTIYEDGKDAPPVSRSILSCRLYQ